jgi:hypothetical protein
VTFSERFKEKATSVRALVVLMLTIVLCINAVRTPEPWREMFGNALFMALGFYFRDAEKKQVQTEGKPTP